MKHKNIVARVFTVVVLIFSLLSVNFTALAQDVPECDAAITLSTSGKANAGDIVTVTVDLSENSHLGTAQFDLVYNTSELEYVQDSLQTSESIFQMIEANPDNSGRIRFAGISVSYAKNGGTLLSAQFKVLQPNCSIWIDSVEYCYGDFDGTNVTDQVVANSTLSAVIESKDEASSAAEDFQYRIENNEVIISAYTGADAHVIIPSEIEGYPVTTIFNLGNEDVNSPVEEVTIPDSVVTVNYLTGAVNLKIVHLGKNVKNISGGAFGASVAQIDVDTQNPYLMAEDNVLYNRDKTELVRYAPQKTDTAFTIPEGVEELSYGAFAYAFELQAFIFADTVTTCEEMFSSAGMPGYTADKGKYNLKTIRFGKNANSIPGGDLYPYSIESFEVASGNEKYTSIDGNLYLNYSEYYEDGLTLLRYASAQSNESFTLPDNVAEISAKAFDGAQSLLHLTLSDRVEIIYTLGASNLQTITLGERFRSFSSEFGSSPLQELSNLTAINVADNNEYFTSVDGNLYSKDLTELVRFAPGKNDTSFIVPETVQKIGEFAFQFSCVETVTIGINVTEIASDAFAYSSLKTISGYSGTEAERFANNNHYTFVQIQEEHVFGEWIVETTATCTQSGIEKRICSICGTEETREIPATGHTFGKWITDEPVTCTMEGHCYRTCSVCGETEEKRIRPTGHVLGEWIVTKEPTCTEWGSSERHCTVCGEVIEFADSAPLDHEFSDEWTVDTPATCTQPGSKSHHCTRCDATTDVTEIPATGHTFGEWIVDKEPTSTESGSQHRVCSVCGYREDQAIEPIVSIYNVTATAGANGTATPATQKVEAGKTATIQIQANGGYMIDTLTVDGNPVSEASGQTAYTYTLTVNADTNISVTFAVRRKAQVMVSSLNVKDSVDYGKTLVQLTSGNMAYIDGEEGDWYKVSFTKNGVPYTGYLEKKYVKIIAGQAKDAGMVVAATAKVYTSTLANSTEATLKRGQFAYIDGEIGSYYLVSFSLSGKWHYGYVRKDYLRDDDLSTEYTSTWSERQGQVMVNEVIVRDAMDADSAPVTVLVKNNKVYINGEENGWYKVSFTLNGEPYEGYVEKQYFKIAAGTAKSSGIVVAATANVYTATYLGKIESTLKRGQFAYIDAEVGDYYLVSFSLGGKWHYGYVLKDYLRDSSLPRDYKVDSANKIGTATVTANEVIVRDTTDENSAPVTVLVKNNKVYVNEDAGDWYKVSFTLGGEPYEGYVLKTEVKI